MTGHNHYSNCTCGWCVNYGGTRIDRSRIAADLRVHDARLLLERNSVRTVSACYVNPNARCPVCGAAVFFYANRHGSRVYFDELGHPWTKHPCTDNPARRIAAGPAAGPPVRRARGLTLELVAAAGTAGLFDTPSSGHEGWRLMVVVSAARRENSHTVTAEYVDRDHGQLSFSYRAPEALMAEGDFVSVKGDLISFLHPETLMQVTFKDGAVIETPAPVVRAVQPPAVRPAPISAANKTRLIKRPAKRKVESHEMTAAETVHFHGARINVAQLCDRLAPVVRAYSREGTRKPHDVSARLNKDGHKTADGVAWTPQLVRFLLALIFSDTAPRAAKDTPVASPAPRAPQREERSRGPLTTDDMASRLSALGRVSVKRK